MEISNASTLLRQAGIVRNLTPNEHTAVARTAHLREVDCGEFFYRQGVTADEVFVMNRGRLKLTQSTPEARRVLLEFVGPGELFGAAGSLEDQVYPTSAQAVLWCQAFAWSGDRMRELMTSIPQIAVNILSEQAVRMRELQNCYRELATERVERRVAHALGRLASQAGWKTEYGILIDMPLSHQDLAEMSGTTLYTVSRILCEWKRGGLVDIGRQRVMVLQPGTLLDIADTPDP